MQLHHPKLKNTRTDVYGGIPNGPDRGEASLPLISIFLSMFARRTPIRLLKVMMPLFPVLGFFTLAGQEIHAQTLQVQLQDYTHATQADFDAACIAGGGVKEYSFPLTYNGLNYNLALQATATPSYVTGGSGYAPTQTGTFDDLYETYIYTSASDLRFNVTGLAPYTTYSLTLQSFQQYGGSTHNDYVRTFSSLSDSSTGVYVGPYTTVEGTGTSGNYPTSLTPGSNGNGYYTFTATTSSTGSFTVGLSRYDSTGSLSGVSPLLTNGLEIQPAYSGPPSMMGSGNFTTSDTGTILTEKINALRAAGTQTARVSLSYGDYYPNGAAGVTTGTKNVINALIAQGITPYVLFEYYQYEYGWTEPITYYNWTAIGTAFATYFGTSVTHYSAVNEPDIQPSGSLIPPTDYATALGNLASGIHSVVPSAKVVPGGYGDPNTYNIWTCGGYPAALQNAGLFTSGALDGIDIHLYWGDYTALTTWNLSSEEGEFQHVKSACGLGDVNLYCTEFNTAPTAKITEAQAAQNLLTLTWSVLTCTKNDNVTPNTQIALSWTIVEQEANYALYTVLSPWTPNLRGATIQLVTQLSAGMQFVANSITNGGCVMSGTDTRLWVIQNVTGWVTTPSATFTCSSIPSTATQLVRYGYDAVRETVAIAPGTSSYTFTDIPIGETTMIKAYR